MCTQFMVWVGDENIALKANRRALMKTHLRQVCFADTAVNERGNGRVHSVRLLCSELEKGSGEAF